MFATNEDPYMDKYLLKNGHHPTYKQMNLLLCNDWTFENKQLQLDRVTDHCPMIGRVGHNNMK